MNAVLSNSTLRRYVLLTFSHVESQFLDKDEIVSRLRKTFTCQTILVGEGKGESGGFHIHFGIFFSFDS